MIYNVIMLDADDDFVDDAQCNRSELEQVVADALDDEEVVSVKIELA